MAGSSRVEVSGIPCHIVDGSGPLTVGLCFRVGWADEILVRLGLTHLVEHLALHETMKTSVSSNGSVSATVTTLMVRGEPDEVVGFFRSVCQSLRVLPRDRMEAEARVLRTEGRRHGSVAAELLSNRFGASGYGLGAFPELGLVNPDPDEAQAWADRWFTAGNATMWATGPAPEGLVLDLPDGPSMPPRRPEPRQRRYPGWYQDGHGMVALSGLVERGEAGDLALWLLRHRLHDRLRLAQGQSYSVSAQLERWTPHDTYVSVFADTLEESAGDVRDAVVGELGRLAIELPKSEELTTRIDEFDRAWQSPEAAVAIATGLAEDELTGFPTRTLAERVAALRAVAPDEVCQQADRMMQSALLHLPLGVGHRDRRFEPFGDGGERVSGQTLVRSSAIGDRADRDQLVVGPAGVTVVDSTGRAWTVLFADLAAAQRWQDRAWTLWGGDGLSIYVHPGEWRNGEAAVALVERSIVTDLVVWMPKVGGSERIEEAERRGSVGVARVGLLERLRRVSDGWLGGR